MPRGRHAALAAVALLGIGAGAAVPALDGGTPAAAHERMDALAVLSTEVGDSDH